MSRINLKFNFILFYIFAIIYYFCIFVPKFYCLTLKKIIMTRGIRNNNPLNLRRGSNWKGLSKVQSDKDFCQFSDVVFGIRAALITLRTYAYKYKRYSLVDVISRFAPSSDGNNVENYCYLVAKYFNTSLPPSSPYHSITPQSNLNLWWNYKSPKSMVFYLLSAMCIVESNFHLTTDIYLQAKSLL